MGMQYQLAQTRAIFSPQVRWDDSTCGFRRGSCHLSRHKRKHLCVSSLSVFCHCRPHRPSASKCWFWLHTCHHKHPSTPPGYLECPRSPRGHVVASEAGAWLAGGHRCLFSGFARALVRFLTRRPRKTNATATTFPEPRNRVGIALAVSMRGSAVVARTK